MLVDSIALPTDSVLRRHALTELNRILGLPPTDSVLRRHYEQLQSAGPARAAQPVAAATPAAAPAAAPKPVRAAPAAAAVAAAPAVAAARPAVAPIRQTPVAPAAPAAPAPSGGLFGWLRRLLGL